MIRFLYLLAVLWMGAFNFAPAKAQPLTVVADEWPPFSGEDLPNRGISLDVISAVLTRAGYEVDVQVLPWARIMEGARNDTYDVYGSLFFDPEMTQWLTYAAPFYETEVRLVRKVGADHTYTTVEALRPYSIAVGDGFLYQSEFDAAAFLDKVVVTTTLQGAQMVAHGRVDLTLDSVDVVRYAMTVQDPKLQGQVELAPGTLATQQIHMAVRNSLPNRDSVLADFNATLSAMRDDGSLDALLRKHR